MPDDRTLVTELATALGTLPAADLSTSLRSRPAEVRIDTGTWQRLHELHRSGHLAHQFDLAFANGRALAQADDGLRGRPPRIIEWTGGRRPPGDEVAPIDLRIDHVYLVSCKYDSDILANTSPARLFHGLLATTGRWDRSDWYATRAPGEYQALYRACLEATGLTDLPPTADLCTRDEHDRLRRALKDRTYPDAASRAAYAALCRSVSVASAERWREALEGTGTSPELMLWRLLRIGSAPYFVLGIDRRTAEPVRYRIASPWDWRDEYELVDFLIEAGEAGQPRVDWTYTFRRRRTATTGTLAGHVEIRWSHGRFAQPPEAKVYLDTPMADLPGYHALARTDPGQPTLWPEAGPAT
ncbi:MAG TPA: hypothetical protein VHZ02_15720 [Acidimicrobiales bacterium]|jgi:hypothetical protein|nr:hypothetical protein [Acidimicrobiales bacterium]